MGSERRKTTGVLYYKGIDEDGNFEFGNTLDDANADYFLPSDMTPYIEPDKKESVEPADKLIKEFIGLAKVVVFQNQNYQPGTVAHRRYKQAKELIEKANKHLNQ